MTDISTKLANQFIQNFDNLRKIKGDNITIGDIDGLFSHIRSEKRNEVYQGIENIAEKLDLIRVEVSNSPEGLTEEKIVDAHLELEAVVKAAEDATNTILDSSEKIQEYLSEFNLTEEQTNKVFAEITNIFEACNFQDITGQRIGNVVKTLIEIDDAINQLLAAIQGKVDIKITKKSNSQNQANDQDLMNGPQINAPTQEEIDKLFADS